AVVRVADAADAAEALDRRYDREDAGAWVESFALDDDESVVRAVFRLDGNLLTIEANSEARVDRALAVVLDALPGAVIERNERSRFRTPGPAPMHAQSA